MIVLADEVKILVRNLLNDMNKKSKVDDARFEHDELDIPGVEESREGSDNFLYK